MALQSLARVEQNLKKREKIKDFYNKSIDEIFHMPDNREVCWVYDIRHPASSIVVDRLKKKNIKARHAFKPMSAQPLFKKSKIYPKCNIIISEIYHKYIIHIYIS